MMIVEEWYQAQTVLDLNGRVSFKTMYFNYLDYCRGRGVVALSQASFSRKLRSCMEIDIAESKIAVIASGGVRVFGNKSSKR